MICSSVPMATYRTSRTFDILFLIGVAVLLTICGLNRVAIRDSVFFATHHPTNQTLEIATKADLTETGRRLLYRTDPQFVSPSVVLTQCGTTQLGCLSTHGEAYILDEASKPNQTLVTATHEMLHLAYQRLSTSKKADLAPLIDAAIDLNLKKIQPELSNQTTIEDRRDEAHSLLGTEYSHLPGELESYYSTYFSDRTKVVRAATE
jgi:hypothetical protein